MWSFLWRPGWILTHLLVITMVVVMVSLGLWQLRRLDERRTINATVEARSEEAPIDIAQLLPAGPGTTGAEAEAVAYRPVVAEGSYLPAEQVLVRNRSLGGAPGYWVLTPLLLADGSGAVAVNRGWVPYADTDPGGSGWEAFAPPEGTVIISGTVQDAAVPEAGLVGASSQGEALKSLAGVDLEQLSTQVSAPLYPVYVEVVAQQPPAGDIPVPIPPPELSEGPHLGYAGQWFIFSALTVVVYGVLLNRVAKGRAGSAPDPASTEPAGPPAPNGREAG